jgi:transposase
MFLRPNHRKKDGKEHTYWSLVETVRTPDGPRQRMLCHLGELNGSAQARWLKTIEVFNADGESRQLKLFPSEIEAPENDVDVARVQIQKVRLERVREFGTCFLGLELWKQLQLDRFFEQGLDDEDADVPWSRVAAVLAINRLCAPGSELAIEKRWFPATALDDLLHVGEGQLNDTRLYRCLDRILPLKGKLEQHLKERYGTLFQAEFDVLLYDLTSSYVEGAAAANPMMKRGYSRDHRPDTKQVVIALIVNREGFPFSYETFDGNRADVTTMETILRMVERKYGKARRVWVFDRGIISEDNLKAIRRRGGQYLVGTPRSKLKQFERELLEGDWQQIQPEVEVKSIDIPGGEESYILCRSTARKEKEQAMRRGFSTRMETALRGLETRIAAGQLKNRDKIQRKIGAIQARYSPVADLYRIDLVEKDHVLKLDWNPIQGRADWQKAREGAYLLRTNLPATDAEQLWQTYIQLTEAEAVFRVLKSELLIRPFFHQLERRIKAHILVAFLGYALWVTLKHWLRRSSPSAQTKTPLSPANALSLLSTLRSADIILPTTDGREIRLRRVTAPSDEQKRLLYQLGISLPERLDVDFECSVDSALG